MNSFLGGCNLPFANDFQERESGSAAAAANTGFDPLCALRYPVVAPWGAPAAPVLSARFWRRRNFFGKLRARLQPERMMVRSCFIVNGPDDGEHGAGGDDGGTGTGVVTKTRVETRKPSLYKVLLLNDDYTPMEFVVHVLQRFFRMSMEDATRVMLHVHQRGVGVCGIFTYEVAETKVTQVMDFARQHQHPLQCTLEKA